MILGEHSDKVVKTLSNTSQDIEGFVNRYMLDPWYHFQKLLPIRDKLCPLKQILISDLQLGATDSTFYLDVLVIC